MMSYEFGPIIEVEVEGITVEIGGEEVPVDLDPLYIGPPSPEPPPPPPEQDGGRKKRGRKKKDKEGGEDNTAKEKKVKEKKEKKVKEVKEKKVNEKKVKKEKEDKEETKDEPPAVVDVVKMEVEEPPAENQDQQQEQKLDDSFEAVHSFQLGGMTVKVGAPIMGDFDVKPPVDVETGEGVKKKGKRRGRKKKVKVEESDDDCNKSSSGDGQQYDSNGEPLSPVKKKKKKERLSKKGKRIGGGGNKGSGKRQAPSFKAECPRSLPKAWSDIYDCVCDEEVTPEDLIGYEDVELFDAAEYIRILKLDTK